MSSEDPQTTGAGPIPVPTRAGRSVARPGHISTGDRDARSGCDELPVQFGPGLYFYRVPVSENFWHSCPGLVSEKKELDCQTFQDQTIS